MMVHTRRIVAAAAACLALAGATPRDARAQESPFVAVPTSASDVVDPLGWTLTPTFLYSASWDDNVLATNRLDQQVGDVLHVVSPSAALAFNGKRGRFDARYDGSKLVYRDLDTLNGFDQRALVSASRAVTRLTSLFLRGGMAHSPTTELQDFVGVPFVRTGATIQNLRGGVNTRLSPRVSVNASVSFERVHFDEGGGLSTLLRGGHGLGGAAIVRRQMSVGTALVGSYDVSHGWVGRAHHAFTVQNGSVGLDHRIDDAFSVSAAAGVSRLGPSVFGPARAGLNWRAGLTRTFRSGAIDVGYARVFEASYGFAGSTQTDEAVGRVKATLPHGFYGGGGASWRWSQPFTPSEPRFRSFWLDAVFGFATQPGVRIEGFWTSTRQSVDLPGARFARNQFGVHVIAARPMRIH